MKVHSFITGRFVIKLSKFLLVSASGQIDEDKVIVLSPKPNQIYCFRSSVAVPVTRQNHCETAESTVL